jgi:hypothetical protein
MVAYRQHHEIDPGQAKFGVIDGTLDLIAEHEELIKAINAQFGEKPVAVVIDTLSCSLAGSENDDEPMKAYYKAAGKIVAAFDCVVIIVHHVGHADQERPRGWSGTKGTVDAQLIVTRSDSFATLKVQALKDGPDGSEGAEIVSKMVTVDLGHGKKSVVVVETDEAAPAAFKKKRPLGARLQNAFSCLISTSNSIGQPVPASFGLPGGVIGVQLDEWRTELRRCGVLSTEDKAERQAFYKIKSALIAKDLVRERDGIVWMVPTDGGL